MGKGYDLTGKWFGDLEVLGLDEEEMAKRKAAGQLTFGRFWRCKCHACGGYRTTTSGKLIKGHTTNCGCKRNHNLITHGLSKTAEYRIWLDMKQKCYNPKNKSYASFGAKGITVCDEWKTDFSKFYNWMILKSKGAHAFLFLKDGSKEFSPENCIIEIQDDIISPNITFLKGMKFGKLTVEKYVITNVVFGKHEHMWLCKCDCGGEILVSESNLFNRSITSCGCNLKEFKNIKDFKYIRQTLNKTLYDMKARCYDRTHHNYKNYGGKGIVVCDEWFYDNEKFVYWAITHGYKPGLSIERININKNYCPENCTWITLFEQAANKSNNVFYKLNDEIYHLSEWGRRLHIEHASHDVIKEKLKELGGYEVPNPNLSK